MQGTRSLVYGDVEVCQHMNLSLVRVKLNSDIEHYSVFAGNAKLSNELGFDVTLAKFKPNIGLEQKKEIDTMFTPNSRDTEQTMSGGAHGIKDVEFATEGIEQSIISRESSKKRASVKKLKMKLMTKRDALKRKEKRDSLASEKINTRSGLFRVCKSAYNLIKKRTDHEGKVTSAPEKRSKSGALVSISKPLDESTVECKIKIFSYIDYLAFMKCQKGLKAGLIIDREEAFAKKVISSDGNSYRIYFARSSFSDKDILRSGLFEKTVEKKCRKYIFD